MLILTRRIGEKLVIGEDAFCTILDIRGNQVRLGFDAPANISVHREEIFLKIKAEQEALNARGSELDINLVNSLRAHQKTTTARQLTH